MVMNAIACHLIEQASGQGDLKYITMVLKSSRPHSSAAAANKH